MAVAIGSGVARRCQRSVEGWRQSCFGPGDVVEGRLQRSAEIGAYQLVECPCRIPLFSGAKEAEPFGAYRNVTFLVVVDDIEHGSALQIPGFAHLGLQRRCDVQPASLENKRDNGEARRQVIPRRVRGLPKAVMGGEVTVVGVEVIQAGAHHAEMFRFFEGNLHPPVEEGVRDGFGRESRNDIKRQIDGVEFDVGDGMRRSPTCLGLGPKRSPSGPT